MAVTTLSAPLAAIVINNQVVGKIQTVSFTENINRGEVQGIGDMTLQEVPVLGYRCTFQANSFLIDLTKLGTVKDPFTVSTAEDVTQVINTLLVGELPVSIQIYRKTLGTQNSMNVVTELGSYERVGIIPDAYLTSKTWNIQDNAVSGKNISGVYLTPIYQMESREE